MKEQMIHKFNEELISAKKMYQYPGITIIATGIVLNIITSYRFVPVGVASVLIGLVFCATYSSKKSDVIRSYKNIFLKELLDKRFENVTYHPNGKLTKGQFYGVEFGMRGNRYSTNDHIEGSYNGLKFNYCDVTLKQVKKSGKSTHTVTKFKGPLLRLSFKKTHPGKLQVLENSRIAWFDDYKRVEMESIAFNETFKVYTTNDHLAFYILTPPFMEKLVDIERRYRGKMYFTFIDGVMNIGLFNRVDYFEVNDSSIDQGTADTFKRDLEVLTDLLKQASMIDGSK